MIMAAVILIPPMAYLTVLAQQIGAPGMEESAAGLLHVCPYHPARSCPPVQLGHSEEDGDVCHVA